MRKEALKESIIPVIKNLKRDIKPISVEITIGIIVGILLLFVFQPYYDTLKMKEEIDYHFDQANDSLNASQFDKAIYEYNEIIKISYNKFPDKYSKAQVNLGKLTVIFEPKFLGFMKNKNPALEGLEFIEKILVEGKALKNEQQRSINAKSTSSITGMKMEK